MAHPTPIVLVTTDQKTVDHLAFAASPLPYLTAMSEVSGVLPLQLPSLPSPVDLDAALAIADGILATGARSNVHPANYGAEVTREAEPFDPDRDATALPLIRAAIAAGVPLLAICRGIQELNVALGGTLHPAHHQRPGRMDHRGADTPDMDDKFRIKHLVRLHAGGRLASILGTTEVMVNSVHRQGLDTLAGRLVVEAEAEDGTIEAVSMADAPGFVLGVQWHPEYWATRDAPSTAIFRAFGDAVRRHAEHRRLRPAAE